MNSETQRGTSPTRGRKTTVALLILCLSLQAIGMGSLSLFLPVIKEDISFSFTQAGTLAAASTLLYFFMQIPAGYLADRFSPKRLFFIGAFGTTALVLAFGFISQYWQALANVTASGFFRALHRCSRASGSSMRTRKARYWARPRVHSHSSVSPTKRSESRA